MSAERFSEDKVAMLLGIPRKELRATRKASMVERIDWEKIDGEICFTLTGIHRLRDFYQFELVAVHGIMADLPKNGRMTMTVVDIPMNPRTVIAEDQRGARQIVEVGRNATFCRGDEIEVGPHETQNDLFQLLSAIPRDKRRTLTPEFPI
jgi:hypothetical protein